MDKRKNYISNLVILLTLACAGYYFVCGTVLSLYYQDHRQALYEFFKCLIAILVYGSVLYYEHGAKGIVPVSECKVHTKRDVKRSSHQQLTCYLIGTLVMLGVILLMDAVMSYHYLGKSYMLIILTGGVVLSIFMLVSLRQKYTKHDFEKTFLAEKTQNSFSNYDDPIALALYDQAIKWRILGRYSTMVCGLLVYLFLITYIYYFGIALWGCIIPFLSLLIFCIIISSLMIKKGDRQIDNALIQGNPQSVLTMLEAFYAEERKTFIPSIGLHFLVIRALYDLEHYERALQLLPLIRVKHSKIFLLNVCSLTLLCQIEQHDQQGILLSMEKIADTMIGKGLMKNRGIVGFSLFLCDISSALLEDDQESIHQLVEKSKGMSIQYQKIAMKIKKSYEESWQHHITMD